MGFSWMKLDGSRITHQQQLQQVAAKKGTGHLLTFRTILQRAARMRKQDKTSKGLE
jgi:hypothetical protein